MSDVRHQFGGDLAVGPTGDLASVDGAELGQQRVLRRLLTNPGDYLWALDYGAGLGQFVGQPADALRIEARIRGQMFREQAVARQPEPVVDVAFDATGTVYVHVRYADAQTGSTQMLSFPINNGG